MGRFAPLKLFLVAVLMFVTARAAPAQSDYTHTIGRVGNVALINHHPACNPFAMAFDPLTWGGRGVHAPRIAFHVGYPLVNTAIDGTLAAIHAPWIVRTPIVRLGLP